MVVGEGPSRRKGCGFGRDYTEEEYPRTYLPKGDVRRIERPQGNDLRRRDLESQDVEFLRTLINFALEKHATRFPFLLPSQFLIERKEEIVVDNRGEPEHSICDTVSVTLPKGLGACGIHHAPLPGPTVRMHLCGDVGEAVGQGLCKGVRQVTVVGGHQRWQLVKQHSCAALGDHSGADRVVCLAESVLQREGARVAVGRMGEGNLEELNKRPANFQHIEGAEEGIYSQVGFACCVILPQEAFHQHKRDEHRGSSPDGVDVGRILSEGAHPIIRGLPLEKRIVPIRSPRQVHIWCQPELISVKREGLGIGAIHISLVAKARAPIDVSVARATGVQHMPMCELEDAGLGPF
jgi:hypothetical protein